MCQGPATRRRTGVASRCSRKQTCRKIHRHLRDAIWQNLNLERCRSAQNLDLERCCKRITFFQSRLRYNRERTPTSLLDDWGSRALIWDCCLSLRRSCRASHCPGTPSAKLCQHLLHISDRSRANTTSENSRARRHLTCNMSFE